MCHRNFGLIEDEILSVELRGGHMPKVIDLPSSHGLVLAQSR